MSSAATTPGRGFDLGQGADGGEGSRSRAGAILDAWRDQGSGRRGVILSVLALLALVAYFWIREPNFLGTQNLTVMMSQAGMIIFLS